VDLTHPIRVISPTLDGPTLEVLARTTRALTVGEVHRLLDTGSLNGVRLALTRLVRQGLVCADERTTAIFYRANRDHLAWPSVRGLVGLRRSLIDHLKHEIGSWVARPIHASLFGSAARGDGNPDSDIDILLVRPDEYDEDESPWADQLDRLREVVPMWTGNHCHPFQLDLARLGEHMGVRDPLVDEWLRDSIQLDGDELRTVLRRTPSPGGRR
jgi:predicted nucleotidyltransferase